MDWTKQAGEMAKLWTGTQQKVWENWLGTMQGMTAAPAADVWGKTIDTWHTTVQQTLNAQVELTRMWAESLNAIPGVTPPAGAADWSKSMLEVTRAWAETQGRFAENWFELIKKTDPALMSQTWSPEQAQKIIASWQDAARKAMEAQAEWSKMVGAANPAATKVEIEQK